MKKYIIAAAIAVVAAGGAYAQFGAHDGRTPVEFFKGHTHHLGDTQGAPQHGGGLNGFRCHNGSVPYHCH